MADSMACTNSISCRRIRYTNLVPGTSCDPCDEVCGSRAKAGRSLDLPPRQRYISPFLHVIVAKAYCYRRAVSTKCLDPAAAAVSCLPVARLGLRSGSRQSNLKWRASRSFSNHSTHFRAAHHKDRHRSSQLKIHASQAGYAEPHMSIPTGPAAQLQAPRSQPGALWTAIVLICATFMALAGAFTAFVVYMRPVLKVCLLQHHCIPACVASVCPNTSLSLCHHAQESVGH